MAEKKAGEFAEVAHLGAGSLNNNNGGEQRNYDQHGGSYNTQNIAEHLTINQHALPSGKSSSGFWTSKRASV